MPNYTLHYFDVDARGELIRLMFAYAGIEYKEVNYSFEEWPKVKERFPFNALPALDVDGKIFTQSHTIVRYLARVAGIDGKDAIERAKADMFADSFVHDIVEKAYAFRVPFLEPDEEKRKEKTTKFRDEVLAPFLDNLEALYEKSGGAEWFCGKNFTYADLAYFRLVNNVLNLIMELPTPHPLIRENYKRTAAIPSIAAYQKNKKQRPF